MWKEVTFPSKDNALILLINKSGAAELRLKVIYSILFQLMVIHYSH